MATSRFLRPTLIAVTGIGLAAAMALASGSAASAATVISGPVDLGTAATYGILGASAVTNTGPTVVNGDLGVSPESSITGFGGAPNGRVTGTTHQTDAEAAQAQLDTTTAYNVAASLSPKRTGLTELNGLSLSPGVYSGPTLQLANNGALTLAGSADSVWVFQAASTLTVGSGTRITITGGASSCNVFWQVGSSATIGTKARFQGTVLANQSITATTGATVAGRLLANNAAVTLDSNVITASQGCPAPGSTSETTGPTITAGTPSDATAGQPYSYTVTATGTPTPTYSAAGLPTGLTINGTTGVISGTPTTPGTTTATVTASNGTGPDATTTVSITVQPGAGTVTPAPTATPTATPTAPATTPTTPGTTPTPAAGRGGNRPTGELAFTGTDPTLPLGIAGALLAGGIALAVVTHRRRARRV
ncbi:hypothetical protein ASG04_01490 [Curtobacterium sp. Leaf183]|uniref:ice-binding family protein n=1 Tax=Curtobacterium sp. Leaf183 TaxID=1736291 RepID=UPI0006FA0457|nr:ice-binding family protein [Curtobacterium sp. Leaf183]KQS14559.1 hypothetical protein ASG04_01490 [Curtobacterium sp. Leaf183]